MRKLAVILCALFFVLAPNWVRAQSEGGSEDAVKVPLGTEAHAGKLVFESADGEFKWWFDSRLQIDGALYFENKNALSNGTIMRRATFALKSVLWKHWQAEIDVDFGDAVFDARDMWIRYNVPKIGLAFQVGNFKEPFGMERLNSSRLLTFLERSMVSNAFPLGRRMGIVGRYWKNYGQLTFGVMGHELGTRIDKGTKDEGYALTSRLTVAPINKKGKTLHLGVAASSKTPDAVPDLALNTIEINARSETYVYDPKLLHTGDIKDVNYYDRMGGEFALVLGPLYAQSEYMLAKVHRWYGKPIAEFSGAYGTVTYMLTGESRTYYVDEGEFGPTDKPKRSWGALELAARFSTLDLNDADAGITGGKGDQWMLGLNYYPNMNIKIQFNYSKAKLDQFATSKGRMQGGDDFSFIQMRFQASL